MRGVIHDLVVTAPGERVRDDEGRWRRVGQPTTVRGRIAAPRASEIATASAIGRQVSAVALLPTGTAIERDYRIAVAGSGPLLDGTYEVGDIVPTPSHLRVLMSRAS